MKMRSIKLLFIFSVILIAANFQSANAQTETRAGFFNADEHPEIIEALKGYDCAAGIPDALADAGTNWSELWGALEGLSGITWSHGCWLITNMPHLDRLEMTRDILLDHVRFAYATKIRLPYKVPDDLFQEYILTYRIGDEPVRGWRAEIWQQYQSLIGQTPAGTAKNINRWVFDNLTKRDRGFFGPRPDPLSIIASGTGTEEDIAAVAIAMCKTFGVPARRVSCAFLGEEPGGRTWLEIYSDAGWMPLYPDNPDAFGDLKLIERDHPHNLTVVSAASAFARIQMTGRYTETGKIFFHFKQNGEEVDYENFSVNVANDGTWQPLDDLGDPAEGEDTPENNPDETIGTEVTLGDGIYVVEVGVRNARGDVYVQTCPVTVNPGGHSDLSFNLDIPVSETRLVDLVDRDFDPLPEFRLNYSKPDEAEIIFPRDLEVGKLNGIFIFDSGSEPSIRMLPLIAEWAVKGNYAFMGVGLGDSSADETAWTGAFGTTENVFPYYSDPDGTIAKALGLSPDDKGAYANLPLVVLIDPNGKICYYKSGFDLNVAEKLDRAVELASSE